MSDKKPESPHRLRSALDRVLVHDIKNMGFRLQMLLSNIDEHYDDPQFKKSVEELLRTTVDRLDGMVERFAAHEDALLIKVALDLNGVIREVAAGSTRRATPPEPGRGGGSEQPTLSLALGAIPEIWGDPYYLRDALWSLIDNAIEATPRGGKVVVRSFTDISRKPNRAVVEIIDNGSGMTQEFLRERLFKPFQTTKPQGVGLGLSTAAEIVRFHEGKINVLSRTVKPGGTIIRLIFPGIAPEAEAKEDAEPVEPSGPETT
ncbi:MAG TPA: ATP-binding protein [Thermoanaerobaculia bacterium]|nr:ATP-binding protein [Thermoanaerobaculia bacterium]